MSAARTLTHILLLLLAAVVPVRPIPAQQQQGGPRGSPCLCNGCPGGEQELVRTGIFQGRPPSNSPPGTFTVPTFDPALGTLVKVRYEAKVEVPFAQARFENTNPVASCELLAMVFALNFFVKDPFGTNLTFGSAQSSLFDCSQVFPPPHIDLAPFDQAPGSQPDFQGASAATVACPAAPPRISNLVTYCSDRSQLATFIGAGGTATFRLNTISSQSQSTTCSNLASSFVSQVKVTVTVTYTYCSNAPPEGTPDTAVTCENTPVGIPVLANDCDADGKIDCSSITITDQPDHGANVIVSGCAGLSSLTGCPQTNNCPGCGVTYTPTAGFTGVDSFKYTVKDDDGCESPEVLVTVTVNAGPDAVGETVTTCKDTPLLIGILQNDVPAPTTTLVCNSVAITDQPDHGTLALNIACGGVTNGGCTANCVRYTPTTGYTGADSFTYSITDSRGCKDTAVVAITVRAGPAALPDTATTCQDQPVVIGILQNDSPAPTTTLACNSVVITDQPDHGTLTLNFACGAITNGGCTANCVRYTPTAGYNGPDSFQYTVGDSNGCASNAATVAITVNAPPNAVNDTVATCKDTPLVIGILQNDVPAPATTLVCNSVAITVQPAHGTLTLNIACGAVTNDGCPANCVRYTPTTGYTGPDSFTYSITDSRGCQDTAVVAITVRAGPTATPDTATTCQDEPVVIGILQNDVPTPPTTLVCNSVVITAQPAHGTLTLNIACGAVTNGGCTSNCVRYTPTAGYNGPDSFQYTVADSNGCASNAATVAITVNAPPNAVNDTVATCKDTPLVIGILQNDVPAPTTTLVCNSVAITVQPAHGTLTLNIACGAVTNDGCPANCVRYTPTSGYTGPDSFTYSITDSRGCKDTAVVAITVQAGPTAVPDTATTCQDEPVVIGILRNDVAAPTTTLVCNSVVITAQPAHGTVSLNFACGGIANGGCPANCVLYTPAAGYNGPDSFQYTVGDSNGCTSNAATVAITVNAPPNAVNDTVATCKDTPFVIGILQNDVPAPTTTLVCNSVAITVQPAHGTLALNIACGAVTNDGCPANCVRYTPTGGYTGPDSFTYSITDSRGCQDTAVVAITVRAGPTAVPDTATTCQDEPVVIGILQNDAAAPTTTLVCNSVAITDQPDHGTLTLNFACGAVTNGGCTANCVRYTPTAGYNGPDSFQYTVTDSNGCTSSPATVAITVNAPPNAVNDTVATCKDTPFVIGILQNDVPAPTTTLVCNSVAITDQPDHGTLTLNIACGAVTNDGCPANCVRYTPTTGYTGPDSFTYSITDSRGCKDTAVVAITVRAGPTAVPDTATTCQDEPVVIGILQNDVAAPTTTLVCNSVVITDQPDHGTLTLNFACGAVTNGGCTANCVRYTPTAGYNGPDSFQYTVGDSNGCASNAATVAITVNAPPNAVNDTVATCEDTPLVIGILQNDVPAPTTTLVCNSVAITDQPDHGTLTLNIACGGVTNDGCPANCVRYTPTAGYTGPDSFTYSITDSRGCKDTAVVQITVREAPAAVPDSATTCQDEPVVIGILQNDVAAPTTTLVCNSVVITDQPDHGTLTLNIACGAVTNGGCTANCVRYTPTAGYNGPDSFQYTVKDNNGCASNAATVAITVNAPPNAVNDTVATCEDTPLVIGVLQNDVPVPTTTLVCNSLVITDQPDHGSLTLNVACGAVANDGCPASCVRYTPTTGYTGPDSFTYSITDSRGCKDTAVVAITVRAGPAAVPDTATTCQDEPVVIGILQNDAPEGGTTLVCNSVAITDQPDHGTLTLNIACGAVTNGGCPANCVRYTPTAGYNGPDSFQYTVTDSNGCTSSAATVTITINAAPNAVNDTVTTCKDAPLVIGILQNDVPAPTTTLVCTSVAITDQPDHGTLTLNIACGAVTNDGCPSNCVRYTPTTGYTGPDSFTYSITDSRGCKDTAVVAITVQAGPAAVPDAATTCPDEPVVIGILQNDVPEGTTTLVCNSVVITDQPDHGTLTLNFACGSVINDGCPANCVRYTPTAGYNGPDSFQYTVKDSNNCTSNAATVAITVNAPPNAVNDTVVTCKNTPLLIGILQNDVPMPTTTLVCTSVAITDQPDHGTLTLNVACGAVTNDGCPANCVRYTPTTGYTGPDSFTYSITDSRGCKDTAIVQIRVCAPVALPDANNQVCQLQSVPINVLANDNGQDSCGVINCGSITIVDPPDHGIAIPNGACTGSAPCTGCRVIYTHNDPDHTGPDTFSYTVKDTNGCVSNAAVVTIQVKASPRVLDRKVIKDPASSAPIANIPVLDGATPGQGCTFVAGSLTIVTQPSFGTAVVNPNGTITYTPASDFPDEDTFCFRVLNSCGCADEGCVEVNEPPITCFDRNRRQCASLLLYPEFSTRPGELTMFTITDACCVGGPAPATYVEFVFIKAGSCLEENRTFLLTPCDTLTFVTSTSISPNTRGYAYAFAKTTSTPGSTPKVFNHLIGDLLFLDGQGQLQYGMNAVAFKGIGTEGSLNDEDHDGVRDLDGLTEYEEAPDKLLIPRFLGQDDVFQSELILIALSGGTAFKTNGGTEVGFHIFDDNEHAFSATHEFYCWEKPRLTDISGAFLQGFLHNQFSLIDDPDEIFGWTNREAGWFTVDGLHAHSPAETIDDPAIYAVLVERWDSRSVAELPFEFCSQINGDLLPSGVFGDPRLGFPQGLPDDDQ